MFANVDRELIRCDSCADVDVAIQGSSIAIASVLGNTNQDLSDGCGSLISPSLETVKQLSIRSETPAHITH